MKCNSVRLDDDAQETLRQIYNAPNRTRSTRDITSMTNLDKDAARYRFKRLEEAGIVCLTKSEEQREGTVATLTEQGSEAIETGLLGNIFDARAELEEIDSLRQRVRELEDFVDEQRRMQHIHVGIVRAIWTAIEDHTGIELWAYLNEGIAEEIREINAKNS